MGSVFTQNLNTMAPQSFRPRSEQEKKHEGELFLDIQDNSFLLPLMNGMNGMLSVSKGEGRISTFPGVQSRTVHILWPYLYLVYA